MTLIPSLTFTDYEWFPWSICNGCGMPVGNAYPSGHLVPSPILGLASAPIVETKFLELAMSLLDSSSRIPLGTFSILPCNKCRVCSIPTDIYLYFITLKWFYGTFLWFHQSCGNIFIPSIKVIVLCKLEKYFFLLSISLSQTLIDQLVLNRLSILFRLMFSWKVHMLSLKRDRMISNIEQYDCR